MRSRGCRAEQEQAAASAEENARRSLRRRVRRVCWTRTMAEQHQLGDLLRQPQAEAAEGASLRVHRGGREPGGRRTPSSRVATRASVGLKAKPPTCAQRGAAGRARLRACVRGGARRAARRGARTRHGRRPPRCLTASERTAARRCSPATGSQSEEGRRWASQQGCGQGGEAPPWGVAPGAGGATAAGARGRVGCGTGARAQAARGRLGGGQPRQLGR